MQIESIFEQGTGTLNEDFHLVNGNLFGVFDGATSLTPATYEGGATGGFLASNIAGEQFGRNDAPLLKLAERANSAIHHAMKERGVDVGDKGNLWSTSAAVVRVHCEYFEWVQTGDCGIVLIHEDGTHELVCELPNQDVETLSLWKESADTTDAPISVAMSEQILKVRSQMNVSYGVFSGETDALSFLKSGSRRLFGVKHIVLFTDGLFIPNDTPQATRDFGLFSELYLRGGLAGVREYIRRIEKTDVRCRRYPRFKTHDDIAAISIAL